MSSGSKNCSASLFAVFPIAKFATVVICLLAASNPATAAIPNIREVRLGIGGTWKVGYLTWTEIDIETPDAIDGTVEFHSVDGEGIGVAYTKPVRIEAVPSMTITLLTKHGRANRPMRVILRGSDGELLVERDLTQAERGNALPVGQPWVVALGDKLRLDQAAMRSAKGSLSSFTTTEVSETKSLPQEANGYRGVDLLVLSTENADRIRDLTPRDQAAIEGWVRLGGEVLVSIGRHGSLVSELPWLADLAAADFQGIVRNVDPGSLESYLTSQKKLPEPTCSHFECRNSTVELILYSNERKAIPLIFRHAHGLGRVQLFAADLDAEPIASWGDRNLLLSKLLNYHGIDPGREIEKQARAGSLMGYDDLAGQLKTTLENYSHVQPASLLLVVAIVALFAAMCVAFDYFVIVKRKKKPRWTWWMLPIWSLLAIAGMVILSRTNLPDRFYMNSLELVDIDVASGTQRGRAWVHQYAGRSGKLDIEATAVHLPTSLEDEAVQEAKIRSQKVLPSSLLRGEGPGVRGHVTGSKPADVLWSGHPGQSIGGFDSALRVDFGYPTYRAIQLAADGGTISVAARLEGVGITTAGSKALAVEWSEPSKASTEANFGLGGGFDLLEGHWTNPMSQPLLDGLLLYRKWMYRLPAVLRPNMEIAIGEKDVPKDLTRYLQRRRIEKDLDIGEAWNPDRRDDPFRLIEMMMFYRTAGGIDFTGLFHRYHEEIDLSDLLQSNRVIIVGRLEKPLVDWSIKHNGQSVDAIDDRRAAFVRFILPVSNAK
jgi:hypothetical protein